MYFTKRVRYILRKKIEKIMKQKTNVYFKYITFILHRQGKSCTDCVSYMYVSGGVLIVLEYSLKT